MKISDFAAGRFQGENELAVIPIQDQNAIHLHTHPCHELVVVYAGRGIHYTAVEEYAIASGDVFVLPPGLEHGYRETQGLKLVNLLYQAEHLPLPLADLSGLPGYYALFEVEPSLREHQALPCRLRINPKRLKRVRQRIGTLEQEIQEQRPGFRTAAIGIFLQLVRELSAAYGEVHQPGTADTMAVGRLLSHLQHHYHSPITLTEMAKRANVSVSTLNRIFQRAKGVSPVEYLLRLRLRRGAELLSSTSMRITEVAFRVGFGDANYFSRQFRQRYGVSPRAYRKVRRAGRAERE